MTLTTLDEKVIEVLREQPGQWFTRRSIASALGRPGALYPHDLERLTHLTDEGVIESEKRIIGVAKPEYVYRVKAEA